MNKKEILEKAKRDYPPGTKFIGLHSKQIYIVDCDLSSFQKNWLGIDWLIVKIKDENNRSIRGFGEYLYMRGEWAEIISLPYPKIYELW
jgi:hypothetical protein